MSMTTRERIDQAYRNRERFQEQLERWIRRLLTASGKVSRIRRQIAAARRIIAALERQYEEEKQARRAARRPSPISVEDRSGIDLSDLTLLDGPPLETEDQS